MVTGFHVDTELSCLRNDVNTAMNTAMNTNWLAYHNTLDDTSHVFVAEVSWPLQLHQEMRASIEEAVPE